MTNDERIDYRKTPNSESIREQTLNVQPPTPKSVCIATFSVEATARQERLMMRAMFSSTVATGRESD